MTKKDDEDFENSTKCWTFDNAYDEGYVKVRENIEENIEVLHIEIVISTLSSIVKFWLYSTT